MLPTIIGVLIFVFIFLCFNHRNKFSNIVSVQVILLIALFLVANIYISKSISYPYVNQLDYTLYYYLLQMRISIKTLSRVYNICIVSQMFMAIAYLSFFLKKSKLRNILMAIPPIVLLIWADPETAEYAHIFTYHSAWLSNIVLIVNKIWEMVYFIYLFIPAAAAFYVMFKAKIFTKKKLFFVMGICTLVISAVIYYFFVLGIYRPIFFSVVGFAKLPVYFDGRQLEMLAYICIFVAVVIGVYLTLMIVYKYKRNASKEFTKVMKKNLELQLHAYKNAFIAVEQRLSLAELYLEKEKFDAVKEHLSMGKKISSQYQQTLNRNLKLLRNVEETFVCVDLRECIESALRIIDVSKMKLTRHYGNEATYVRGVKFHLTEVFVNLFKNAVTAMTGCDRAPELDISVIHDDGYYMVEITDNGIGINKADRKKIFDLFYSSKGENGTGVGLYYVKRIVEAHGGEVRVISKEEGYTTFQIVLLEYEGGKKHGEN